VFHFRNSLNTKVMVFSVGSWHVNPGERLLVDKSLQRLA
jgi:hypothetical protein